MVRGHKNGSIHRAFHGKWIHFSGSSHSNDLGVSHLLWRSLSLFAVHVAFILCFDPGEFGCIF